MASNLDLDEAEAARSFLTDTDLLAFLLEEVARRLRRQFDASVEQFGLTGTQ